MSFDIQYLPPDFYPIFMIVKFETRMFDLTGEDLEHPNSLFGKSVANFLKWKLIEKGYKPYIVPTPEGWQVKIEKDPILLSIKISAQWRDIEKIGESMLIWVVSTEAEVKKRLLSFFKKVDPDLYLGFLDKDLKDILFSEKKIKVLSISEDRSII